MKAQHERLKRRLKLGNTERDAMRHEPGNEMNVAAEPIELRNGGEASLSVTASLCKRGGELRTAVKRLRALARLDFGELGNETQSLSGGEPRDGGTLGVDPEPRATLLACACGFRRSRPPIPIGSRPPIPI